MLKKRALFLVVLFDRAFTVHLTRHIVLCGLWISQFSCWCVARQKKTPADCVSDATESSPPQRCPNSHSQRTVSYSLSVSLYIFVTVCWWDFVHHMSGCCYPTCVWCACVCVWCACGACVFAGFTPDVKVWEVCFDKAGNFHEVRRAFELKGHSARVHWFAFSADSHRSVGWRFRKLVVLCHCWLVQMFTVWFCETAEWQTHLENIYRRPVTLNGFK